MPTVEPTVAVIDIANDPNARLNTTPPPTPVPTVAPTAAPTPSPTAVALADQDLMGGIMAASLDPLLAGGRLGLVGGILVAAGFLAIQQVRRRR